MAAVQPVAVYAMRIPPGDMVLPATPDFSTAFRITMAAVDPSEEIETEDVDYKGPPRATLKIIRVIDDEFDDDDDDSEDDELDLEDYDDSDDDEENGGPSTKKSKKQKLLEALAADAVEDEDEDMSDDEDDGGASAEAIAELQKLIGKSKGKGKLVDGEEEDSDSEDDDSEAIESEESVVCTLDPEKYYQQPLDIVVSEGEKVFFKVTGTHTIYLTGNYIMPIDDGRTSLYDDDEEDDDYDLSPDEDELDAMLEDDESDELDDLDDPRVTEVADDDEDEVPKTKKGKNKRPADDSEDETGTLEDIMAQSIKKAEAVTNGEPKKLSKAEKKAAKKIKKNDGEAAAAATSDSKKENVVNGNEKKVQFSKELVQGPTPSATPPTKKADDKKENKKDEKKAASSLGIRDVNGVSVDDRKLGSGPAAKKGSRLEMRYIGKLENGKVFDSNKSGKPFSVKVGVGEVIRGWDLGLVGISAGGERRLTIPAHLAYGSKSLPGIPKNSKLIFDVKCLSVK